VTFPFLFDLAPHIEGASSSLPVIYTLKASSHASSACFFWHRCSLVVFRALSLILGVWKRVLATTLN